MIRAAILNTLVATWFATVSCAADTPPSHQNFREEDQNFYVVDQPFSHVAKIGKLGQALHVAFGVGALAGKVLLAYWASRGRVEAALAILAMDTPTTPGLITLHTFINLDLRYRWRILKIAELLSLQGYQKIYLITTSELKMALKFLIAEKKSQGFIIIGSDTPISDRDWHETRGDRIVGPISPLNTAETRLRIEFVNGTNQVLNSWMKSFDALLGQQPVPDSQVVLWQELFRSEMGKDKTQELKLQASLVLPDGSIRDLGPLSSGKTLKKFLSLNRFARMKAAIGFKKPKAVLPVRVLDENSLLRRSCRFVMSQLGIGSPKRIQ